MKKLRDGAIVKEEMYEEAQQSATFLPQACQSFIQVECSSCGLKWISAYDAEACPMWELEAAFLSADWFVMSGE